MILQNLMVSTGRPSEEVSNKQSISSGAAAASHRRSFGAPNRSCSEPPIARGCKRTSVRRICRESHRPGRVPKCIRRGDTETSDLEEFPRTHTIDFVSIILDRPAGNDCLTLQRRSNVRAREPGNSVLAPPDERLTTDLSRVKPGHVSLLETIAADPTLAPRPRSARGRDRSRLQQVQESCVHQPTIPAATTSATCSAIRRLRGRTAARICPHPGGLSWSGIWSPSRLGITHNNSHVINEIMR
jgi:hypothetical protein